MLLIIRFNQSAVQKSFFDNLRFQLAKQPRRLFQASINLNNNLHLNYMRKPVILILFLACLTTAQLETNSKGFIETNSVFLFDTMNGNQANNNGVTYSFSFNRNFTITPRVGLAVYTMAFEYSPVFSCQVTSDTTTTSATLIINTQNSGRNNQLYLIYIATDHNFLGVFMPGALITFMLNQGLPGPQTQSFPFNFKAQISSNSQMSNIKVAVFLTGITSSSQLVSNGYPTNYTIFSLSAKVLSSTNYMIDVSVNSQFGDISVSQVQYTIIYFDITIMQQFRYLINRGDVTLQNFGGTSDSSSKSITLSPLPVDSNFQNLNIFHGISSLQCRQGASITLSAFYENYLNPQTQSTQTLLTMQTWQLTFMLSATYNFIQYQSLKCGLPGANCDGSCLGSSRPHFVLNGVCSFCQSSCLSCNITNTNTRCDTCDETRFLSNSSGLCLCLPGFHNNIQTNKCDSCFPCRTCNLRGVCLTCDRTLNMVLNTILATCECAPGFYNNYVTSTNSALSNTLNSTAPCLACPQNCLYCLKSTFCLACNTLTYLNSAGKCIFLCNQNKKFDRSSNACSTSSSAMFDQEGRLGYEWSYTSNQSQLQIILTFSQSMVSFYYYQNAQAYSMANSAAAGGGGASGQAASQAAKFYFDDGANSAGYASDSSQGGPMINVGSMQISPSDIFGNSGLGKSSSGQVSAASIGNLFQQGVIDSSALNGSFYGLGQQQFIKFLYQNYLIQSGQTYSFYDQYGIPYGKYNLSTNKPIKNPNFAQALQNNIVVTINNDTVPFTMVPLSRNQFKLSATVSRSYYGDEGFLLVKNPGLIRSGSTATQLTNVSRTVYIYDCNIPSYVDAANSIYNSNSIIVQVLWGLGKYPLFIGFGWVFMPLMLTMQYIMSLNYIDTTKPLNLDRFLASFADFRNPSIFYNPVRNNIDNSIVSHPNMYMNIRQYNRFDRGIDFMKNCFQFFFVPFLSVVLYAILVGVNKILNSSEKDIPFISKYLKARFPLHIAAYTLVQALPVSFFFFAQLNDTRYSNANQPNSSYPIFNVAMSYLAFFLTCSIPLMLMTHIYFIYTTKENKVKSAKDFKELFANLLQSIPQGYHKAGLNDPLWTADQQKLVSYGFGIAIFYLAVAYGFFISFFYDNYAWQITGLVLVTAALLAFAAVSGHFQSLIIKAFWIIFAAILLAFLFLLAGIGSNSSTAPCDKQNLGYLGIGLLYALILVALIASCIVLWFTIFQIYNNYFKDKKFVVSLADSKQEMDDRPQRIKTFQSTTKLKSTYMKNPIQSQIALGSKMNIGSMNLGSINGANDKYRQMNNDQDMRTEDRMIIKEANGEQDDISHNLKQNLLFYQIRPRTNVHVFVIDGGRSEFLFDQKIGRRLKQKQPLYIDNNQNIYDKNNQFLGNYQQLKYKGSSIQPQQMQQIKQQQPQFTANEREMMKKDSQRQPIIQYTESRQLDDYDSQQRKVMRKEPEVVNIYIIDGEQYEKIGQDNNGLFIVRNKITNQIRKVQRSIFNVGDIRQVNQQTNSNSLQKQLPKQDSKDNVAQNKRQVNISPQIQNNKVVFAQRRRIKYNNNDYIDYGLQGDMYKLYNVTRKTFERVPKDQYVTMTLGSFDYRVNINNFEYQVERIGLNKSVHLIETNTRNPKIVSQEEFIRIKQQNYNAFRQIVGQSPAFNFKPSYQFSTKKVEISKGNEDQGNILNNLLLLQSKAGRNQTQFTSDNYRNPYNVSSDYGTNIVKQTSTKTVKEIQITNYKPSPQQAPAETEVLDDQEQETIDKVLQRSPGPFQIFVVPDEKVEEQDGQDKYSKEDAIETIILQGKNVNKFMEKTEKKHPNAVMFMLDMKTKEEYRLN